MTTSNQPNAPTLATRIPESRPVEGLEYGRSWDEGHAVRPRGRSIWGLARAVPEMDLADDADLVKAITTELEPWDGLPPAFHPAVAVLLKDGGIRSHVEAGVLQEVLAEWPGAGWPPAWWSAGSIPRGVWTGPM